MYTSSGIYNSLKICSALSKVHKFICCLYSDRQIPVDRRYCNCFFVLFCIVIDFRLLNVLVSGTGYTKLNV